MVELEERIPAVIGFGRRLNEESKAKVRDKRDEMGRGSDGAQHPLIVLSS